MPNTTPKYNKCHVCSHIVLDHQTAFLCDLCQTWLHFKCLKMTREEQKNLSSTNEAWFCPRCVSSIFPFSAITKSQLLALSFNSIAQPKQGNSKNPTLLLTNTIHPDRCIIKKCSLCIRKVKPTQNGIVCCICSHLVHLKCSNLTSKEVYELSSGSLQTEWACYACLSSNFPFKNIDDFSELNFNSNFNCSCRKLKSSFSRISNPESLPSLQIFTTNNNVLLPNANSDPDNELPFEPNFKYYSLHQFHKFIKLNASISHNSFSVFHTNIRSLKFNFEDLTYLLDHLDFQFDIVALSETWMPRSKLNSFTLPRLSGYHELEYNCGETLKSGCALYIKDELTYIRRNDLTHAFYSSECEFQSLWIEIFNKNNSSNILVNVIYLHPKLKCPKIFLDYLENMLNRVNKENKKIIICGDINLDLLKTELHEYIHDYLSLLLSHFFIPQIIQPTRFSNNSRPSLIDHIFVNVLNSNITSGNLIPHITDHLPNFIVLCDVYNHEKPVKNVYMRNYSNFEPQKFIEDPKAINLTEKISQLKSTNDKYNFFHDKVIEVINAHAPLSKLSSKKQKQLKKPWITKGIRTSIKKKNNLYHKFMRKKEVDLYNKYKVYRNKITHLIRHSKKNYYLDYFNKFKTNMKKLWQGIKELINLSTPVSSPICLQEENELITNPLLIANKFNTYFNKLASNIVSKMKPAKKSHKDFLQSCINDMFDATPTTEDEVKTLLHNLDKNKSPGIYNIPIKLIKVAAQHIAKPLELIINDSFANGCFPQKLKIQKIIPLHKGGSKLNIQNYRPISLLPIFSKIIEQTMLSKLKNYLNSNNILFEHQYGFQKNKSTVLAVLDLLSKLTDALDNSSLIQLLFF